MKNIILFDDDHWKSLLPLTYTRPIAELRVGILTIKEKWEKYLKGNVSYITQDYLAEKFPIVIKEDNYIINGTLLPNPKLVKIIDRLELNQAILSGEALIAARLDNQQFELLIEGKEMQEMRGIDLSEHDNIYRTIRRPHDIFTHNKEALQDDFNLLTKGRTSQKISTTNQVISPENIFLEEGASDRVQYIECFFWSNLHWKRWRDHGRFYRERRIGNVQ